MNPHKVKMEQILFFKILNIFLVDILLSVFQYQNSITTNKWKKMIVFYWQKLIFIYSNMCEDVNLSIKRRILFVTIDIIHRLVAIYICICSITFIYFNFNSSNKENLIFAAFQASATIILLVTITSISWNKQDINMNIEKVQELVNQCKKINISTAININDSILFLIVDQESKNSFETAQNKADKFLFIGLAISPVFAMILYFILITFNCIYLYYRNGFIATETLFQPYKLQLTKILIRELSSLKSDWK